MSDRVDLRRVRLNDFTAAEWEDALAGTYGQVGSSQYALILIKNVLFVNPASIAINELEVDNIVGRNVRELMADGYFEESSTLNVLEAKTTVSLLQHLKHDKKVVATGVPILEYMSCAVLTAAFSALYALKRGHTAAICLLVSAR